MIAQKFIQFEIGQPFYESYNDGSFIIYQKISKSEAKVVCIDPKNNLILRDYKVGMIINKIPYNSIFGKIL